MRVDILTLFPEVFESPLSSSIIKRAQDNGLIEIALTNIRDFSTDNYRKVDDKPYGGGPGMVMRPGPVFDCFGYAAHNLKTGKIRREDADHINSRTEFCNVLEDSGITHAILACALGKCFCALGGTNSGQFDAADRT